MTAGTVLFWGWNGQQPADLILCASERLQQEVSDVLPMVGVYQSQCIQGTSLRVWTS